MSEWSRSGRDEDARRYGFDDRRRDRDESRWSDDSRRDREERSFGETGGDAQMDREGYGERAGMGGGYGAQGST
jgi:hypothetical protein